MSAGSSWTPVNVANPACADPEWCDMPWVPSLGERVTQLELGQMRAVCGVCQELDGCREYGLHHDVYGMWGGLTDTERAPVRRVLGIRPIPLKDPGDRAVRRARVKQLLADGLPISVVADRLGVSQSTVIVDRDHVESED